MDNILRRYVSTMKIKGYSKGVIKTKRVWCMILNISDQDSFNYLVNSGTLKPKKDYGETYEVKTPANCNPCNTKLFKNNIRKGSGSVWKQSALCYTNK